MRIREHYLEKTSGESKIYLDLDGKLSIVYVTKHGLQILDLENTDLTSEQVHEAFKFIEEYLNTISEEEKPILENKTQSVNESTEQSSASLQNQTTNPHGEVTSPPIEENPQSVSETNKERSEGESLGEGMGQ